MAAIRRGKKKVHLQKKKSKRQRGPRKNVPKQKKLPPYQKRNICVVRFPKTSYLKTCPLVSWYFKRRIRNNALSFRRHKNIGNICGGYHSRKMPHQAGRQKKQQRIGCTFPAFLKAALKEVASKKRAKWVVAPAKRRPHYSDDEIFYKLAKASEDEGSSSLDTEAGTSGVVTRPLVLSQPMANEPQSVSS